MAEIRKRKDHLKVVPSREDVTNEPTVPQERPPPLRYGPLPTLPNQKAWTRGVLAVCVVVIVYFTTRKGKETMFASHKHTYEKRSQEVPCSASYIKEISAFPGCVPERCGRAVTDSLVSQGEVADLLHIATQGLALGGSDGGASVLDLHSGALSQGRGFVNLYRLPEAGLVLRPQDFVTYKMVRAKIQEAVARHFGINQRALHLTHPTFFSRLTSSPPKTVHDEYWHVHVDKETYESFHYTSLLYLSDWRREFEGGRFVFVEADNSSTVVEPRRGRVSMFTSGQENPHLVERVSRGARLALTVSFTCDSTKAIRDPQGTGS